MSDLVEFRQLPSKELALEMMEILDGQGIPVTLSDSVAAVDLAFSSNGVGSQFMVNIRSIDFERAEQLLEAYYGANIDDLEKDYYLFGFSKEELYEILNNYDEWSTHDYAIAQTILRQQGEEIDDRLIEQKKEIRYQHLAKAEKAERALIQRGYRLAWMGGFFGISIGWDLSRAYKVLPDGKKVYRYRPEDRKEGEKIFLIAIITSFLASLLGIVLVLT